MKHSRFGIKKSHTRSSVQFICNFITFACLQKLFELINERNTKCRFPSPLLAVDETLYLYRGAIGFKQNPKKAAKYGVLYRRLCNSSAPYTSNPRPYAQKPEVRTGDSSKYYVAGKDEYKKYLVTKISRFNSIERFDISMDRYFTAVSIAEWEINQKFTIVDTMRHDRKSIPKERKSLKDRE